MSVIEIDFHERTSARSRRNPYRLIDRVSRPETYLNETRAPLTQKGGNLGVTLKHTTDDSMFLVMRNRNESNTSVDSTDMENISTSDLVKAIVDSGYLPDIAKKLSLNSDNLFISLSALSSVLGRLDVLNNLDALRGVSEFLDSLYAEDIDKASSSSLVHLINTVFGWISKEQYNVIDVVIRNAKVASLAPEIIVGLLRVTANVRHMLPSWDNLLRSSQKELDRRGYNSKSALKGLFER